MTSQPLLVVGCGAAKQAHRAAAGDMYFGGYHRACRKAAAAATSSERTLILSAQHGLLHLTDVIDPYEQRMGQPGAVPAATVRRQAQDQGLLDATPVVVLAGQAYRDVVRQVWPEAHSPLTGIGGLGKQLAALAQFAENPARMLPYVPPTPGPRLVQPGVPVESIPGVGPKTGGRYGGTLVRATCRTTVVDCRDGLQRRFPSNHLRISAAPILSAAWSHLGYIDPHTGQVTTDGWDWLGWTIEDHLAYRDTTDVA